MEEENDVHFRAMKIAQRFLEMWISREGPAPPIGFECWLCSHRPMTSVLEPNTPPPIGSAAVETERSVWRGRYFIDVCIVDRHGFVLFAVEIFNTHKMETQKILDLLTLTSVVEIYAEPLISRGEWMTTFPMFSHPSRHPRPLLCTIHDTDEWDVRSSFIMTLIEKFLPNFESSRLSKLPETIVDIEPFRCGICGAWTCVMSLRKVIECVEDSVGVWDPKMYTLGLGPRYNSPHAVMIGKPLVPTMYENIIGDVNIPWTSTSSSGMQCSICLECKSIVPWWEVSVDGTLRGLYPYVNVSNVAKTVKMIEVEYRMTNGLAHRRPFSRNEITKAIPSMKQRETGISRYWV